MEETAFPVEEKILEAEEAATGKQEIDSTGNVLYVEFYTGKVKRNGQTIKTGRVYWTFAVYKNSQRQYRVSPKNYSPEDFSFEGATTIEHCPYTGRVTNYWKGQQHRATGGDGDNSGLRRSDETIVEVLDSIKGRENLYVH